MSEAPTNIQLAEEASSTLNDERQCELACHPSAVVKNALGKNPHLCDQARAILDRTAALQQETAKATTATLGET